MTRMYYEGQRYCLVHDDIGAAHIVDLNKVSKVSFEIGADSEDVVRALEKCPSHDAKEALLASYF